MKSIAVIFGGRSTEHDVSVVTALASVIKPLELTREYKVEPVYIARDGAWYWDQKLKDIALFTSGEIDEFVRHSHPASVQFDGGMTLVRSSGIAGRKQLKKIDIVFPAMHGTYGEDGDLMGLLEMAGVPYVGCGVAASAIAMDKLLAKKVAIANNILTPKFVATTKSALERNSAKIIEHIMRELRFPLFVKPTHLGSSIGISRVENEAELQNGLEVSAHYDSDVLVEEAVENLIELTLPIMGSCDYPIPSLLERPLTKSEDFFDFETKYMHGGKKGKGAKSSQGYSEIPAKLSKNLYSKAEATALSVWQAVGCSGFARIDLLVDKKLDQVYFNEINPMPGSLYSHNWNKAGISSMELVQKLVDFAEDRFKSNRNLATTFNTNYLKQF